MEIYHFTFATKAITACLRSGGGVVLSPSCGAVVPGTHELLQDLAASKVALSHAHSVEHTLRQELTRVKQKAAVKVTLYPCNPTPCPDPITPL